MLIRRNIEVPTGNILIGEGEHGPLEFLSLGDYGKEQNVKADFMGLNREIKGVPHGDLLPLEEKWVITISPQYGCSMGCNFCDVPKVGPGRNATAKDLIEQVLAAIHLHPEVKRTKRLNLHYARMGEPTFNFQIFGATNILHGLLGAKGFAFHPVVSTMMPLTNNKLAQFLRNWIGHKWQYAGGEAGLQISINTTDEGARFKMFGGDAMSLLGISQMLKSVLLFWDMGPADGPFSTFGRKIALNFALSDAPVDAGWLRELFDPQFFMCKITPMHVTQACQDNGIMTTDGYEYYYPYEQVERELKAAGFDVLVFVPSLEEDRSRITCGNAILSGTEPDVAERVG